MGNINQHLANIRWWLVERGMYKRVHWQPSLQQQPPKQTPGGLACPPWSLLCEELLYLWVVWHSSTLQMDTRSAGQELKIPSWEISFPIKTYWLTDWVCIRWKKHNFFVFVLFFLKLIYDPFVFFLLIFFTELLMLDSISNLTFWYSAFWNNPFTTFL